MPNPLDLLLGSRDALLYFLRIAILICGYIVVRPVIEACFRRFMTPQDADMLEGGSRSKHKQTQKHKQKASLRQKSLAEELLADTDDDDAGAAVGTEDDTAGTTSAKDEWGGMLRKRQRARFEQIWEEEQARVAEEEELRELEDLLED